MRAMLLGSCNRQNHDGARHVPRLEITRGQLGPKFCFRHEASPAHVKNLDERRLAQLPRTDGRGAPALCNDLAFAASAAVPQRGRAKSMRAATAAKQTSARKTVLILLRCGSTVKK